MNTIIHTTLLFIGITSHVFAGEYHLNASDTRFAAHLAYSYSEQEWDRNLTRCNLDGNNPARSTALLQYALYTAAGNLNMFSIQKLLDRNVDANFQGAAPLSHACCTWGRSQNEDTEWPSQRNYSFAPFQASAAFSEMDRMGMPAIKWRNEEPKQVAHVTALLLSATNLEILFNALEQSHGNIWYGKSLSRNTDKPHQVLQGLLFAVRAIRELDRYSTETIANQEAALTKCLEIGNRLNMLPDNLPRIFKFKKWFGLSKTRKDKRKYQAEALQRIRESVAASIRD